MHSCSRCHALHRIVESSGKVRYDVVWMMNQPKAMPVRPTVRSETTGEVVLLEDEIRALLEQRKSGRVALSGPPGSGKTSALQHLAAVLPASDKILYLDSPSYEALRELPVRQRLVVYTSREVLPIIHLARFPLAPWGIDQFIEYLLAVHPHQCASVVGRIRAAADWGTLQGLAELCRIALDEMAAKETITNAGQAMLAYLARRTLSGEAEGIARHFCLAQILGPSSEADELAAQLAQAGCHAECVQVLRHVPVQVLLAAQKIAADLSSDAKLDYFQIRFSAGLVHEAASLIRDDPAALGHLEKILQSSGGRLQPMAASILYAANPAWVPTRRIGVLRRGVGPWLTGGYFRHAAWPGVDLRNCYLGFANLQQGDLTGANLEDAQACGANFQGAILRGASLKRLNAPRSVLCQADLREASAEKARFTEADLQQARFDHARLKGTDFTSCNLEGASFVSAVLVGARFNRARLSEADFTEADLTKAEMQRLVLRESVLRNTCFCAADLRGCDLESVEMRRADFRWANLTGAVLTGSLMADADFSNACLRRAKLAEIDWEGAKLCEADLRQATFHMGSSRGGLVPSPIACEGSRTGFYSDDYNDQDFKAPEEIRKANLCGADLRGARIEGLDFYLVDLRGARYDAEQERHFRRCGAILESRC